MSRFIDYDNNFNIKKFVKYLLSFYKWFIITAVVFIAAAYVYNKTLTPVYQNGATIFISKQNKNILSNAINFDASVANSGIGNDDEITLMNSFQQTQQALDELDMEVTYYEKTKTLPFLKMEKNIELYTGVPVKVIYDGSHQQPIYQEFGIQIISENKFKLSASGEEVGLYNYIDNDYTGSLDSLKYESVHMFNEPITTDYFSFTVTKTGSFNLNSAKGNTVYFLFNHLDYLTLQYQGNLEISQPSPTSSILNITIKGNNYHKITDFLNRLLELYINNNLSKKNQLALSTIQFIDNQLGEVSDSLSRVESNLERFRSANQVTDLSFQGQRLFEKLNELETEKAAFMIQKKYYNYLKETLSDFSKSSDLVSPSSMGVVDPILTDLVSQLVKLNNERNVMLESSSSSIYLKDADIKISNLKKTILENVENSLNTLEISVNEINYRINNLNKEISKLPKTELKLIGIQRKFDMNDAILTFLMQKRAEAQIAKASTSPDYEIVEPARKLGGKPVSPNTTINYVIALFLAIVLPIGVILGKDFLNTKIADKHDINNFQNLSFLGSIYTNNKKSELVFKSHPNSAITESFRAVRTNFQFFLQGINQAVIAITSSTSGEGKSFFSANFASAFALNNQRAVLLEFDLRRPKLHKIFQTEQNYIGLSSYLINAANVEDIIQPTQIPGLDLISAGPVAPNPAELISSPKTVELINLLKEMYNVVIIDSAPVGIISETYYLMQQSDISIFVVRQNYSIKEMVDNTIQRIKNNKISNLAVLLNDVNFKKESYKYGYNKNYYTGDSNSSLINKITGKKANKQT